MNLLFVIPARGGSKGLPKKNIKQIAGKPLLQWSAEAALKAAEKLGNSKVVLSTDDNDIASLGKALGLEVPFMRPDELSNDTAASIDVVLHALDHYQRDGFNPDYVFMIEPTSPQRDANDLINSFHHLLQKESEGAESLVGVCKTESCHPLFLTHLKNGFLEPYSNKEFKVYRRQEIDSVYFFEGSMYLSKVSSLKGRRSFYHDKTLGYEMQKWKSFEIDDMVDFIVVEQLLIAREKGLID